MKKNKVLVTVEVSDDASSSVHQKKTKKAMQDLHEESELDVSNVSTLQESTQGSTQGSPILTRSTPIHTKKSTT